MSQYPRGSLGHVLHALREYGIPETIAGSVQVGDGLITYGRQPFASYKYFDDIEQPLFRFQGQVYMQQKFLCLGEGRLQPQFRLTLSVHGTPAFEINGHDARPELHDVIIHQMLVNDIREKGYRLSKDAGAFFQGGSEKREGQWIYIEFWKPKGAQAWVDYLNEIYQPPAFPVMEFEKREYDAAWVNHEIQYAVNGDMYKAGVHGENGSQRMQGVVTVQEDVIVRFRNEDGVIWNFNPPLLPHKQ